MIILKNLEDKIGRKYSKDELMTQLTNKLFYGELTQDYLSDDIDLGNLSHTFQNFRFDGNDLHADITILKTPQGMILEELIKNDIHVVTSLRATGYVDDNKNITDVNVLAIDFLVMPTPHEGN